MRTLAGVLLMAVVLAVPVSADEVEPHLVDPCGDAGRLAWLGDQSVDHPVDRSSGFDIEAVWFEDIVDGEELAGVRVHLDLCGDVPDPELPGAWWGVGWQLDLAEGDERTCWGSVRVADEGEFERIAAFVLGCSEQVEDILGGSSARGGSVWSVDVESFTVAGSRITWELLADELGAEQAEVLEAGTAWRQPSADTGDFGGRYLNPNAGVVGVSGGARDSAWGGRDFVVGG